ncbi:MAG: 3-methyl-2-oxobutanoate hydroxymethyltransferase [Myxococcales bacterium]|nr:3-methyl-2-oxobutanoate hydroxymethyltransferase [Myxococcales bacterium]
MSRITIPEIMAFKNDGQKIAMLTCYDATFAQLLDQAEVPMLLVGDSLGMVYKGEENTLSVTVDEVAYHTKAVARGSQKAHIVADMPFMSYHGSEKDAVINAGKLLQAGAQSVKLEGGKAIVPMIKKMVDAGIPVMGHIGLMPQKVHMMGGFKVQGKDKAGQEQILEDAQALVSAGVFGMVLEGIPSDVAQEVTQSVPVPTIGIGAGSACDGQVLVIYDLLGFNQNFRPKFVKTYFEGGNAIQEACQNYVNDVVSGTFPSEKYSFKNSNRKS